MKTRNLSSTTIDEAKNKKNVAGNKNSERGLKYLQEQGLVSLRSNVNTLRNFRFGKDPNSYLSHVISPLHGVSWARASNQSSNSFHKSKITRYTGKTSKITLRMQDKGA